MSLLALFEQVIALRARFDGPIDIVIHWPPSRDRVDITVLTDFDRRHEATTVAAFSVALSDDHDDPSGFVEDVVGACPKSASTDLFVRLDDSAWSIRVSDAAHVWDHHQPRFVGAIASVADEAGSPRPTSAPTEAPWVRGQSFEEVTATLGIPADRAVAELEKKGVHMSVEDGVVRRIEFREPFANTVCGVWIGASGHDVMMEIGAPLTESRTANDRRLWVYDRGGHLAVAFDSDDRVVVSVR